MAISNSKEWYNKSEIDYFSAFLKLWLAFNAFYKRLYQHNASLNNDRKFIEEIKNNNNIVKTKFEEYFTNSQSSQAIEFRFYLSEFIRKYSGVRSGNKSIKKDDSISLKPQMNGRVVDEIDFSSFIHSRNNSLKNKNIRGFIKIEHIYIKDDINLIFPFFIEMLYMMRNSLVHGTMEPTDENHQSIKCCYIMLRILIKDLV